MEGLDILDLLQSHENGDTKKKENVLDENVVARAEVAYGLRPKSFKKRFKHMYHEILDDDFWNHPHVWTMQERCDHLAKTFSEELKNGLEPQF